MDVSFYEVNNILKTLPIGYYAKRKIDTELSETGETSFYNMLDDKIVISFPCIHDVLSRLKDDTDLEETVRTLLYHEVSHAILTPTSLKIDRVMNIFEDERIESLLKDFYMNINFKQLVVRVNDYHGEAPKTADEAFYQLVRYRVGDKRWLDMLHELIVRYSSLNRQSNYRISRDYRNDIHDFYDAFVDEWMKDKKEEDTPEKQRERLDQLAVAELPSDKHDLEHNELISEKQVEKMFKGYTDQEIETKLASILNNSVKRTKQNGSAIHSYSGVFNPRAVIRDDYKYFTQQSRNGHIRQYSKIHLNLFIDRSGSFSTSEFKTNQLLYALTQYEKKNHDFTFDVVFCGVGQEAVDRAHRELECYGGNRLTETIFEIYRNRQLPEMTNYNIVLFDGYAFTDSWNERADSKNFGAFNHQNCVIISDHSNARYIDRHCKNATKIYTDQYVDELFKHVLISLTQLMK